MGKMQLNQHDGRKGSKFKLFWTDNEITAFEKLNATCKTLELFQPNLDRSFRLNCDANNFSIEAELAQEVQWSMKTSWSLLPKTRKIPKQLNT